MAIAEPGRAGEVRFLGEIPSSPEALHRLTPVWVPDAAHEAMRDLVWARATARRVLAKARQQSRATMGQGHAGGAERRSADAHAYLFAARG